MLRTRKLRLENICKFVYNEAQTKYLPIANSPPMPTLPQPLLDPLSAEQSLQAANDHLMFIVKRPMHIMGKGKGSYLWSTEGKRFLDFIQGWAVNCLGHSPSVLVRAITHQARELINGSPALWNQLMIDFARLLTTHSALDQVFFASSGAEANEGAIKLARRYGQKHLGGAYEIITTWNSFHGRTLTTMAATGKPAWDGLFEPKTPGFVRVPFNHLAEIRKVVSKKTCAIMIEPIQGEGGVFPASKAYMEGLRTLCDETGIALILDEVQTGIGRTGSLFAYEQYGIEPDIMTLGKGLGGGFPVSALLAKTKFSVFEGGDQGGTYCAQPLAMAAGLAVVGEVIRKNLSQRARTRGNQFKRGLKMLCKEFGFTDIRSAGLLAAVDLPKPLAAQVYEVAFEKGFILNACGPSTLRFMPALTTTKAEIEEGLRILSESLRQVLR